MAEGYRSIEWRDHNAARNYPFDVTATKVSTNSLFEIANNVFIGAYIYVPTTRDVNLASFFIDQITNMPTYVLFSIAYKPPSSAAIKIGTVKVNRANYVNGKTYKIAPLTDWSDITGYVVIDE